MRKNRGSKWEPNWVRHYSESQAEQGEVLDDCCHIASALGTFRSEDHVITHDLLLSCNQALSDSVIPLI